MLAATFQLYTCYMIHKANFSLFFLHLLLSCSFLSFNDDHIDSHKHYCSNVAVIYIAKSVVSCLYDTGMYLLPDFAEKLFKRLEKSKERFEVRLLLMHLISRLIGVHQVSSAHDCHPMCYILVA